MIRLTGDDLQRLVQRLGLPSVLSLKTEGLVSVVRESDVPVWRPRLRFRTKPLRQCPFLVNEVSEAGSYRGLCSLHPDHKPLVCALSPLSRTVEDGPEEHSEAWSFLAPVEGCPGVGRGDAMALAPPAALRERLDAETRWMRRLMAAGRGWTHESQAWDWLAAAGANS